MDDVEIICQCDYCKRRAPQRSGDRRWCEECMDGWVPGSTGVERCDTCGRFKDDDAARDHVRRILRNLIQTI